MEALSPGSADSQDTSEHEVYPLKSTSRKQSKIDQVPTTSSVRKRLHSSNVEDENESESFARYISLKLKKIRSDQRVFVEKIINDVLFEAEMGTLNRGCYLHMVDSNALVSPLPQVGMPYVVLENISEFSGKQSP